jgi:hypothetical protein
MGGGAIAEGGPWRPTRRVRVAWRGHGEFHERDDIEAVRAIAEEVEQVLSKYAQGGVFHSRVWIEEEDAKVGRG